MSTFKHPLARDAKVWQTSGVDGHARKVLVIITTLELDQGRKRYKADMVDKLSDAARAWLQDHALEANDFMLMSRPKDWN